MTISLIVSDNKIGFCYQSPRDESWEGPCIFPWVYLSISSKERPERARLVLLIQYANHGLVISELSYSHNEDHEDVFFHYPHAKDNQSEGISCKNKTPAVSISYLTADVASPTPPTPK